MIYSTGVTALGLKVDRWAGLVLQVPEIHRLTSALRAATWMSLGCIRVGKLQ